MRIAIIDLGTVSVRFEIFNIRTTKEAEEAAQNREERVERIYRERQMLRLGDGLYHNQKLSPSAIEEAKKTFARFKPTLEEFGVEQICAAATSALREANDGVAFIEELSSVFKQDIEIISGEEEAALTAQGVLAYETNLSGDFALVDIGGGSTEISFCRDNQPLHSNSLNIGAIRCQQMFLKESPPIQGSPEEGIGALRRYIKLSLDNIREQRRGFQAHEIIGSSGSIRTLCRVICGGETPEHLLTRSALQDFIGKISPLTLKEISEFPHMEASRADIILAGAFIFEEIMGFLGVENARPSMFSLRHGLLEREIKKAASKNSE